MAESELGPKEVLSVLNQLDLDVTQMLNQRRAFQQVRAVTTAYQKMQSDLNGLEAKKAALEADLATLQERYDTKQTGYRKATADCCASAEKEQADIKAKLAAGRKRLADLEAQVKDKEAFAERRGAELEKDLKAKTAQLEKLTADYDAFRKKHGLASGE